MAVHLADGVDTVHGIVTAGTRLHCGVNDAVVEDAAETKCSSAMAHAAVDGHLGMALSWARRIGAIVAGRAVAGDRAVVNVGSSEINRGMTKATIRICHKMPIMLADGRGAVMAGGAGAGNTGMVKFAIRPQFQKAGGGVARVTFNGRRNMKVGFARSQYTVVTTAANCENLAVVDSADDVEPESCMTGLTEIAGGEVIACFRSNGVKRGLSHGVAAVVTVSTLG